MNNKPEIVGSISDAARNWHLAAGAIFSARFGVKLTPKTLPAGDGPSQPKQDSA